MILGERLNKLAIWNRRSLCSLAVLAFLSCSSLQGMPARAAVDDQSLIKLETHFFEHPYKADSTDARLTRLEKLVFGEARTGSDSDRLNNLMEATKDQDMGGDSSGSSSSTASSSSAPMSGAEEPTQDASPSPKKSARTEVGMYPRVTRLEESLLSKSYETDPVEDRLTRLETKAFGAPTTIQDLSERTDRLEEYVASKNPSGGSRYPSQGSDDDQQQLPPIGSASAPPAAINLGQTVSTMEIKVFGKTETGSLVKRIGHLEKSVYKDKKETDGPLPDRVTKLAAALQMSVPSSSAYGGQQVAGNNYSQTYGQTPNYGSYGSQQQPPSYGGSYSQQPTYNGYGQQSSTGGYTQIPQQQDYQPQQSYNSNATTAQDNTAAAQQKQKSHSSILGGLAKALVGVGSMAGSMMGGMGSMGYGMGGMGYGSPYGGYGGYGSPYGMGGMGGYGSPYGYSRPYGYGGYGMGGYGSSMGGLGGLGRMFP